MKTKDYELLKRFVLVLLSVIALILTFYIFTGCSSYAKVENTQTQDVEEPSSMFVEVEKAYMWEVVYQKDTKVMYAVSYSNHNCGTFTLLVNPDGTPMIYEGDKNGK